MVASQEMMQDLIIQDGVQYGGTYGEEWFPVAVLMIGTFVICRLKGIIMTSEPLLPLS